MASRIRSKDNSVKNSDGRSKLVYLTEAGSALRNETIVSMGPEFERMATGFDLDRLTEVLPVLTDLRVFMDKDRNEKPALRS